jgi:hypothetical protein
MVYLLTAIGLTPGGSSTVHIYTQTIHRTTQLIWEGWVPCPVFASYTLAFAIQLRKKHWNTSVSVAEECPWALKSASWHLKSASWQLKCSDVSTKGCPRLVMLLDWLTSAGADTHQLVHNQIRHCLLTSNRTVKETGVWIKRNFLLLVGFNLKLSFFFQFFFFFSNIKIFCTEFIHIFMTSYHSASVSQM